MFSYIKSIYNFKKISNKTCTLHGKKFILILFTFKQNDTMTVYNILKYLFQRSYLLSVLLHCNQICDDMIYMCIPDYTIFRKYVRDIRQSNCIQYIQQDNL